MFQTYLDRWNLRADGDAIITPRAHLLPVIKDGAPAMLKLSDVENGGAVLQWWDGDGAARVLARDTGALLLERATGIASLSDMSRAGQDDDACRILCKAADKLHAPRAKPLPELIPLTEWFRELAPAAATHGGILQRSAHAVRTLLDNPRNVAVLHGDLHHDNVLDFGARGWLAIDPNGLLGERNFDFANIFTNPDLADSSQPVSTVPGRFARRLDVVTEAAGLERSRLLLWILAWTGLSAAWFISDDDPLAAIDLQIAELAAAELDR